VEVARRQLRRVRQLLRVSTPSRRIDSAPPRVAASAGGVVWAAGASEAPHGDPGCCNGQRIAVFLFSFWWAFFWFGAARRQLGCSRWLDAWTLLRTPPDSQAKCAHPDTLDALLPDPWR
jgi:hypothetical protein